jgi:hypothetical protein
MKRDYNTGEETKVTFFVGTEVEHTPAFGKLTLFVVGVQPMTDINLAIDTHYKLGGKPITHIYFGANMSFPKLDINDAVGWSPWENMVEECLRAGFLCTLDIDVTCAEGLLETGLVEYHNFIPMISIKLPYIQQLGYNATIKLDDKDFKASNPGVWCHSLHDLKNRDNFTDWSKYTTDEIIK